MNGELKFNFENLLVYQKSIQFIELVYSISSDFPKSERYLNIAKGSVHESVVCVTLAHKLKYINAKQEEELKIMLVDISKMCSGLISKLKENTPNT